MRNVIGNLSRTSMTSTMNTLDDFSLLELSLGHTAHTIRSEIGVTRLNAPQAAQILISGLFPLGDEISIGYLLVDAIVVELLGNGLAFIVQIVDVPRLLMVNLEYGPENLSLAFAFVWRCFGFAHLLLEFVQRRLD